MYLKVWLDFGVMIVIMKGAFKKKKKNERNLQADKCKLCYQKRKQVSVGLILFTLEY